MAFKDILVHLDGTDQSRVRLEAAADLALEHEAHLTGLYVFAEPFVPVYDAGQLPPSFFEEQEERDREQAGKAEKMFTDVTGQKGAVGEWRTDQGPMAEMVSRHAHYCDLVVVGQRDPDHPVGGDFPDGIILTIGRPVLIIPYVTRNVRIGKRVMVAWDARPQSTRAVHDALPFMTNADEVDVIAVNPNGGHGEIPCADISLHLARHGIKSQAQSITVTDIGVADMLLSRAADQSIDLLVMGAYGHSRWRELILGGVTAHMLEHMTMPVLMSH